jgi:DNA-binding transcriptional MerR regulator
LIGVESMRGIGRMSRESGLTVSALRFYDGAGLLCPAHVDPHTGYRFYAPEQVAIARLVAALRRAGMPLAGIREVLERRRDPVAVDAIVADHVRALEEGLADARRVLSTVPPLLATLENTVPTTVTVPAHDLAAALRAVRFAVGADPRPPVLGSVLFDVTDVLTLVATDRYRLATAPVPVIEAEGPAVAAVVPVALADRIAAIVDEPGSGTVAITVADSTVTVRCGEAEAGGPLLDDAYPDHRRLLPAELPGVPVDAAALRAAVAAAPARMSVREQDGSEFAVTELAVGAGGVTVAPGGIGVNREFLLEAVDAGGDGQLLLALDGPVAPIVLRSERSTSLLMPVRL